MGYAVLHLQKGSSSSGGLGNHIDRVTGKEHSFKNANPKLIGNNRYFKINKYCHMNLSEAISRRIGDGYKSNRKMRSDAVKYCSAILTGSHEDMIEISKDKSKFNKWLQANYDFAAEQWGAENIVRFALHLDEKTPHLHCVFVPLTEGGRLSARQVIGNKKALENLQDKYAIQMEQFNLKRGLRGSKAKHETVQEYYARADRALKPISNEEAFNTLDESIQKPSKLDIFNLERYVEKTRKDAKNALNEVLKEKNKRVIETENENRELKKELGAVKGHLNKLKSDLGPLNETKFSLKIGEDSIVFSSEGFETFVKKDLIKKTLDKNKFNSKIKTIQKKIFRDVLNAQYQKALSRVNLLQLSPDNIEDLGTQIVNDVIGYSDEMAYTINQEQIQIAFEISEQNDAFILYLKYYDPYEGKDKNKELLLNSRMSEKNVLVEAIHQAQIDQFKRQKKGRGIGR